MLQGAPQLPAPRGYVNDFAGVISADDQARIQRVVDDVRAKSGGEIVIITLKDLGDRDIADVAREFGRQWKVGKKGNPGDPARNTGVIILVVPKETSADGRGHVRIETGSGAEGFITDGDAGAMRDAAIPDFRRQDYGSGILLITSEVAQRFAGEFHFTLDSSLVQQVAPSAPSGYQFDQRVPPNGLLVALFIAFFFFIVFLRVIGAVGRGCGCLPLLFMGGGGRGWSSGGGGWSGGGGGFGGFGGGGGFSGGGASGSW